MHVSIIYHSVVDLGDRWKIFIYKFYEYARLELGSESYEFIFSLGSFKNKEKIDFN